MITAQRRRSNSHSVLYRFPSCMRLRLSTSLAFLVSVSWLCFLGRRMTRHMSDVAFLSRPGQEETSSLWWTSAVSRSQQEKPRFENMSPILSRRNHYRRRTTTTVKNRSIVQPNEFVLPPNESSWRYFDESASRPLDFSLHAPSNNEAYGQLPALWQCQKPKKDDGYYNTRLLQIPKQQQQHRNSKVIFVHLSRSAGNMVRSLLQYYGKQCQTSYAVVLACADLSFQSAQAGHWYNGRRRRQGNHCQLKEAYNRTGGSTLDRKKGYVSTAFLEKMDIVAGQLPLGSADQAWKYYHDEVTTKPRKVQYVLLLREPIAKFISEEVARGWRTLTTTKSAVAMIEQKVLAERAKGNYRDSYTPNLITPEQHFQYEFHEVRPTMDQYVNVSMSNLVDLNVVIGIVERMPQSLQLLQHVLDSQHALDDLFQYFGTGKVERPRAIIGPRNTNPGLSTAEVLKQVRQDETLYRKVREYVKYELRIYNFALELHKRQYQKLPKQKPEQQQESKQKRKT